MYATVNTTPPPPSGHNRSVPPMLDLIVAKAMAKLLEDRYQSVQEFAGDLREVRRQMDASRPASALKAAMAPPLRPQAPNPAAIVDKVVVDTATIPIDTGKRGDEDAKPLAIAKTFDSFDATMRLAAMTDQTDDFKEYISETQKMRAYKGKIEPTSPLARAAASPAAAPPAPAPAPKPVPAEKKPAPKAAKKPEPKPEPTPPAIQIANPSLDEAPASSAVTSMIAIGAIVMLSLAALGLMIALVVK